MRNFLIYNILLFFLVLTNRVLFLDLNKVLLQFNRYFIATIFKIRIKIRNILFKRIKK